jgi:LPXTG-site transpeptidase (sortase) family protein
MKKSTIIVVIAIVFLSFYAMQEVSYFSSKMVYEKNISSSVPVLLIPEINLNEKINFESLNKGVLVDELSSEPNKGKIILHGHRTLLGSPFLRLNELKSGDIITLQWPKIGEVNFTINRTYIVPASHTISMGNDSKALYLITCDPIGTSINRLIVEAYPSNVGPLNEKTVKDNPNEYYALIIAILFLSIGLIFTYFYPVKEDRLILLTTVLILSLILFGLYIYPISPDYFSWLGSLTF